MFYFVALTKESTNFPKAKRKFFFDRILFKRGVASVSLPF